MTVFQRCWYGWKLLGYRRDVCEGKFHGVMARSHLFDPALCAIDDDGVEYTSLLVDLAVSTMLGRTGFGCSVGLMWRPSKCL